MASTPLMNFVHILICAGAVCLFALSHRGVYNGKCKLLEVYSCQNYKGMTFTWDLQGVHPEGNKYISQISQCENEMNK
jgi:hypothetical protein